MTKSAATPKAYYDYVSGHHPTIHCNRMPTWEEMAHKQRLEWQALFSAWVASGRAPYLYRWHHSSPGLWSPRQADAPLAFRPSDGR